MFLPFPQVIILIVYTITFGLTAHPKTRRMDIFIVRITNLKQQQRGHFNDWPRKILRSFYFYAIATIDIFLWYMCRGYTDYRLGNLSRLPFVGPNKSTNHSYKVYFHVSNTPHWQMASIWTPIHFFSAFGSGGGGWARPGTYRNLISVAVVVGNSRTDNIIFPDEISSATAVNNAHARHVCIAEREIRSAQSVSVACNNA